MSFPPREAPTALLLPALNPNRSNFLQQQQQQPKQSLKSALSGTGHQRRREARAPASPPPPLLSAPSPPPRAATATALPTPTHRPLPPLFLLHYLPAVPDARPLADPATSDVAAAALLLSPLPPRTDGPSL